MRSTSALATLMLTLAVAPLAQAQAPAPAPRLPSNLQVLPKDTPPATVTTLMRSFTQGLGVQCTYCHVQAAPVMLSAEEAAAAPGRGRGRGGPPPMDYAADDKPEKQVARVMLRMVNDINTRLQGSLRKPAPDIVRVQCITCHRGVTDPRDLAEWLSQTMLSKGDSAAVSLYRSLRQRYYGTEAYDFREPVLRTLAQQSLATNKPDDALSWLQLNVEFYPSSAASYVTLAQVHLRKRDRDAAVKDLETALRLEPGNADAKRQLEELKR